MGVFVAPLHRFVLLLEVAAKEYRLILSFISMKINASSENRRLLTLVFEAMSMLPSCELRVKIYHANSAIDNF